MVRKHILYNLFLLNLLSCFVAQDKVYLLNISWTLKKNLYSAVVWGVPATYIKLVDNIVQVFYQFSSVAQSCTTFCDPHELQHARPPCPSPTPGVYPNSCPLSRWCHPDISSSVVLLSSALSPFQHQSLFKWISSLHQVAKILKFQLQYQSFQWTPRTDL